MTGIDTNFLVHARRAEMPHHRAAKALLQELAEGEEPWALPWPCVYEFLRVVTHPRVFKPPTDLAVALADLESLLSSPSLILLGEGPDHRGRFFGVLKASEARGNLVHDAHIATLLIEHGVTEFWTLDRDFRRFAGVRPKNPFA
jgi:toxin-antitoxin system PIN domain toxin